MEQMQKKGAYRWFALAILTLAFTTSSYTRFLWAPVMTEACNDLGMLSKQGGDFMSAFYFGYLILQVPAGIIADKVRCKYPLAGIVFIQAVLTFMMQYIVDYTTGYALRFVTGLVSGAILAFCSRLLSNYFNTAERRVAFGILMAAPSIGTLLSNQIGPRIMAVSNWKNAYAVCAWVILAVAVMIVAFIKEPAKVKQAAAPAGQKASFLDGLKNYFSVHDIVALSVVGFLYMAVVPGFSTWANSFMKGTAIIGGQGIDIPFVEGGKALSNIQAGNIMTFFSIFSIAGAVLSGPISKKWNIDPKTFIAAVLALMGTTVLIFGLQRSYNSLMVMACIFGFISCGASTQITTWAVNIGGDKYAATTTTTQNMLFQISNVIFPTVAGALVDQTRNPAFDNMVTSYNPVWFLYTGLVACSLIVLLVFTSRKTALESMK